MKQIEESFGSNNKAYKIISLMNHQRTTLLLLYASILIIPLIVGCKKEARTIEDIPIVNLKDFTYKNNKLGGSEKEILAQLGMPDSTIILGQESIYEKEIVLFNFNYCNLMFYKNIESKELIITGIEFNEDIRSDNSIQYNGNVLHNRLTIKKANKIFNGSKKNVFKSLDNKDVDFSWIELRDTINENSIRLNFYGIYLSSIDF